MGSAFRSLFTAVTITVISASVSQSQGSHVDTGQSESGKSGFISLFVNGGVGVYGGGPTEVFDREGVFGFGMGLRYRRITLSCAFQFGQVLDIKSSYEATTQWESLDLTTGSFPVDLGYQFAGSRRFFMEPFVGLRWSRIGNELEEAYVNWERWAASNFWPTAGARFKVLTHGFDTQGESIGYFVAEIRLSYLDYRHEDYGKGYSVHLMIGYGGDIVL